MGTISNASQKDLEKHTWNYVGRVEEEQVQLLEDSSTGMLSYFFSPYFSQNLWILGIVISLGVTLFPLSAQLMYFILCEDIYPGVQTNVSDVFCAPWVMIHCFLYYAVFFVNYIYCKATVDIETNSLQKLLEEIAEIDFLGDSEAWRKISFRVNRSIAEERYHNPIFYSGEQCRRFFVREISRPMESGSYDISWFCGENLVKTYFEDASNRMLAEKAIANYGKSIGGFDGVPEIDRKKDRTDRLFGRFYSITMTLALSLGLLEIASFLFMTLALIVIPICYAIFNAIFNTSSTSS